MPYASRLEDEVKQAFPQAEVTLIKGSRGAFEVIANDELVYSKHQTKRHAEPGEVVGLLQQKWS